MPRSRLSNEPDWVNAGAALHAGIGVSTCGIGSCHRSFGDRYAGSTRLYVCVDGVTVPAHRFGPCRIVVSIEEFVLRTEVGPL